MAEGHLQRLQAQTWEILRVNFNFIMCWDVALIFFKKIQITDSVV